MGVFDRVRSSKEDREEKRERVSDLIDVISDCVIEAIELQAAAAIARTADEISGIIKENEILKKHIKLLKQEREAMWSSGLLGKLDELINVMKKED